MGDVCGKGADAAAVTALARYTLRAAAMRERLPSRSLRRSTRRCCASATTAASAPSPTRYLEREDGGARVGFASGGHPLPILLRADGSVEAVGRPGTLLGVLPDPQLRGPLGVARRRATRSCSTPTA